jgi:hypothetical protein
MIYLMPQCFCETLGSSALSFEGSNPLGGVVNLLESVFYFKVVGDKRVNFVLTISRRVEKGLKRRRDILHGRVQHPMADLPKTRQAVRKKSPHTNTSPVFPTPCNIPDPVIGCALHWPGTLQGACHGRLLRQRPPDDEAGDPQSECGWPKSRHVVVPV